MTKEQYFEMCEMLGNEPLDSETPIDMNDFPPLVQNVFQIYFMLSDIWDSMGGSYIGKNLSNVFDFFRLYELSEAEQLLALSFIQEMDSARRKIVSSKIKANKPSGKSA